MLWLAAAIFVSILFSKYPEVYRQYYYAYELLKTFGFCILLYVNIITFGDIYKIETILIYCFTFMGVWGIQQSFLGNERLEGLGGNDWGDSNGVAAMFVLIFPVALAKAFASEKRRDYWVSIGIVSIMVILIVCTQSRGGLLGLVASLFSFGYFARKTQKIIKIALILILVAMPFVTDSYLDRINAIRPTDSEDMDSSAKSRLILWHAGLMIFADNPIFGTGFMTYPEAKMKYENRFLDIKDTLRAEVFRTENKYVTHNTYIQLLSECGLFGAIPFIILLVGNIQKGIKFRNIVPSNKVEDNIINLYMSGISAGIIGYSVCNIFLSSLIGGLFYYQITITAILYKLIFSKQSSNAVNNDI